MSLIKNLQADAPVQFGRYTDSNKNASQLAHWNNAQKFFSEKKYVDAYHEFFLYLGDRLLDNVEVKQQGDSISFTVHQGSKIVRGNATNEKVVAEVNVARFEKPGVAWMRKLMNMNYNLKYSRFAITDDRVCMKFTSHTLDGSPTKLYHSLKELALNADKQDDLLTDEFGSVKDVDVEHVADIPVQEKEVKYQFLHKWIDETLAETEKFDPEAFCGAVSYLLLTLTYKIDYLIVPEGKLAHDLEAIHTIYFAKDNKSYQEKNTLIIDEYRKILEKPKEYIFESLYRSKCTFGIVTPVAHKEVSDFILNESVNATWYINNNYPKIVLSVYEYINGYNLFNFGMYTPAQELSHFLMEVINQDYFNALGMQERYTDSTGMLNKEMINARCLEIANKYRDEFPKLTFGIEYMNYNSLPEFAGTFITEIAHLDFTK